MIASPSDFNDKESPKAQDAFGAVRPRSVLPESVPSPVVSSSAELAAARDAVVGVEVARQVMRRGARSRVEAAGLSTDPAAVAIEPEVIGGKGSRMRRCIVTGDIKSHEEMIRFVVSPDGVVTPDLDENLPGRGHWVTARYSELYKAVVGDAFSRAARSKVVVPPAMINLVITLARRSCLNTLGLARRDWNVEFGYEHVRLAINAQKVGIVLVARNAPLEMQHKLDGVKGNIPTVDLFTTAELSSALGRDSLAFASVNKGQWTVRLLIECNRLAQLQTP